MTAELSGDEKMITAYNDKKDLYAVIAQTMYNNEYWENLEFYPEGTEIELDGQKIICGYKTHKNKEGKKRRSAAKTVLLGMTYGRGANSIAEQLGVSKEEGQKIIDTFFKSFPKVKKWIDDTHEKAKKLGYVEDFYGRRRHLPDVNLPKYSITYTENYLKTHITFNPFLICDNKVDDKLLKKYEEMLKGNVNFKQFEKIKKDALYEGVNVSSNNGFIARAERQSVNAIIQGCLDGDSLIYTQKGVVKIKDVVNQNILVWDGCNWSKSLVLSSGLKQKCVITTNYGNRIVCSPNHKFLTINTKGNEKFKELRDIKKQDRIIINYSHPDINNDVCFRSMFGIKYVGAHNKNNYSFDDINDTFIRGQILGRIASDGSYIKRQSGGSSIKLFIAEHEKDVLDYIVNKLPFKYTLEVEQKKNQKLYIIRIYSETLVDECIHLDIKHQIPKCFYSNLELMRGFISGFFDGDGSAKGGSITLTFGTQCDFNKITQQIRDALLIFGIRSKVHKFKQKYRVDVSNYDAYNFSKIIGFINKDKQLFSEKIMPKKDNKTFNYKKTLQFKNIEFTNEFVEMYDVCNTERGYFVVDGIITHNSAATLTKLAMINIYNDKELNDLGLKMLIPIHDELLCTCPKINGEKASQRLVEVMVNTAKPFLNVPMQCDPYTVSNWYFDELSAQLQNELEHLQEDMSREEALEKLKEIHCELLEKDLLRMLDNK